MELVTLTAGLLVLATLSTLILYINRCKVHPLSSIPGSPSYALTSLRLAYDDLTGQTSRQVHALHSKYGSVVRIGPDHVSFDSLTALKAIYGVGSRANRTSFYKIFEPYGRPTMFTMSTGHEHGERKKYLIRAYAKTGIVKGPVPDMIETKTKQFLDLLGRGSGEVEICQLLYFFTLDLSTSFVYTQQLGTAALTGDLQDRELVRGLGLSRRGRSRNAAEALSSLLVQRLSLQEVVSFREVRKWARKTFDRYRSLRMQKRTSPEEPALIAELWNQREKRDDSPLEDIDLASECADHLAAAIETTRNTLVFVIWALSLPECADCQQKLRQDVAGLDASDLNENGLPTVDSANRLPYVNAAIKEVLRLYAPLPQLQPRFFHADVVVDGYRIPAHTVVSMAPYTQHRNAEVYEQPYHFRPERWLGDASPELQRWWWPFSNGGRACTGMHFAMATMTTFVASLYMRYETSIHPSFENVSPAIISIFETFWDERYEEYQENTCIIDFRRSRSDAMAEPKTGIEAT